MTLSGAGVMGTTALALAQTGDCAAQVGQGPMSAHRAERLRTSDRGVVLLRRPHRLLREQSKHRAARDDSVGVSDDPVDALVRLSNSSNGLIEAAS